MNKLLLFLLVIFIIPVCFGYEKIIQYDQNDDIIVSTTVYGINGKVCTDCNCNLKIYNPSPYENFINSSHNLISNGNGIYTSPTLNLSYNKEIYPISLECNNSAGYWGGDDRVGIKVSETTFDFTSGMIAMIGVTIALLGTSFIMDKRFKYIKLITFFSGFVFMMLSLGLGYAIVGMSPIPGSFKIIFSSAIVALLMIVLVVIFLYMGNRLEKDVTQVIDTDRNDK